MRTVIINGRRQISFTKEELEVVGVTPGDEFIVTVEKDVIVLTPVPSEKNPS